MFSETVAQKPTVPLSAGIKNFRKSEKVTKRDGAESMGPNPPAALYAQPNSRSPTPNNIGALMPCRNLMYSIPLRITSRLMSQNAMKQMEVLCATCPQLGASVVISVLMASPPIQV